MKKLALLATLIALSGCAGNYKNTFEHPPGAEPVSLHVAPVLNQEELSVQISLADSSAATAQYGALGALVGSIIDSAVNARRARKAEIRAEILRELAADFDLVNAIEQTTSRIGNDERWKIVSIDKPVSTTKEKATAGEVMDKTEADAVILLTASYALTPGLDQVRADIEQKVYMKADRMPGKNPRSTKSRFMSYLSPKHPLNYRGFNAGEKESLTAELNARYDRLVAAQPDDAEKLQAERADAITDLNEAEEIPEAVAIREAWSTQLLSTYLNQAVSHLTHMLQEDWRATVVPEEAVRTASTFSYVSGLNGVFVNDKGQEIGRRDDNVIYRTQWATWYLYRRPDLTRVVLVNNAWRYFCLAAVVLLVTACATSDPAPRVLLLKYGGKTVEPSGNCIYVLDGRSRDTLHGVKMPTESVTVWLQRAVQAQLGMTAYPVLEVPVDGPYVMLQKAYITPIATVISGIVVLKLVDGEAETVVRGRATRTNWWGADSEQVRLLSDALDDALYKVGGSIGGATSCVAAGGQ